MLRVHGELRTVGKGFQGKPGRGAQAADDGKPGFCLGGPHFFGLCEAFQTVSRIHIEINGF